MEGVCLGFSTFSGAVTVAVTPVSTAAASTLGEGSEFGFFIGFGPGLTLEVLVVRAAVNV
jgi:hypothetical protein